MLVKLSKRVALAALGTAIGFLGLASAQSPAHADSFKTISKAQYIKTTRAMYTGEYHWKNGKRGSKIITPKGTILEIEGFNTHANPDGSLKNSISLGRGDLHYDAEKNIDEVGKWLTFHPSDFKAYKLKVPFRTHILTSGTGYTTGNANCYKPAFHITIDGYLEYYNSALLKKHPNYDAENVGIIGNRSHIKSTYSYPDYINLFKPTATRKISSFKVKGNNTYLYYSKPINGLTEKKVSSHKYRLTITKNGNLQYKSWGGGDDQDFTNAQWQRYTVGGHPFFDVLSVENGD